MKTPQNQTKHGSDWLSNQCEADEHAPDQHEHRGLNVLFAMYKGLVSPMLHALAIHSGGCCFQPSCSEYAALACSQYGLLRGGAMALWRLLRCNPLAKGGWDPVPPAPKQRTAM